MDNMNTVILGGTTTIITLSAGERVVVKITGG
jgi:hypothetical protein